MNLPISIKKLADRLARLPSIGPRQSIRLVFHLISRGQNDILALSDDIRSLLNIGVCSNCFFIHQNSGSLCDICLDTRRDKKVVAIVEKETDLLSIENTGKFNGRYLILGPISKSGILEDWQKLRLQNLKSFIQTECGGKAKEIILAFSPTTSGDFNASVLVRDLALFAEKITRLGRGLPTGGEIEFADDETLGEALAKRD